MANFLHTTEAKWLNLSDYCKSMKGALKRTEGWYGRETSRVRFPRHPQQSNNKPEYKPVKEKEKPVKEEYIMTSVELDQQFIDDQSDNFMTEEEREYWIDLEESYDEEEKEVLYETCDDELVEALFNECFNIKSDIKKQRLDQKRNTLVIPKGVISANEIFANRLANKFNKGIK